MNMYSVVPNADVSAWLVKLENVAPEKEYKSEDEAITAAKQMAEENKPSILQVMDKNHNVVSEERYLD